MKFTILGPTFKCLIAADSLEEIIKIVKRKESIVGCTLLIKQGDYDERTI